MNDREAEIELTPESQRIRDVYAHYGLAMYLAQNVERGLSMVLALDGQTMLMTAWGYDSRLAENYQTTFGGLVSKFERSSVAESSSLISRLQRANDQRNVLAHQYFWDRAIQFASPDGQLAMMAELRQMQTDFSLLDDDLSKICDLQVQIRGEDIEVFHSRVEASLDVLLSGARVPHNPERVPNQVEVVAAQVWYTDPNKAGNLVLISNEGRYLAPGERGICYGPLSIPANTTTRALAFDKAFPTRINPRPKAAASWNYDIPLANGYILRAETNPSLEPGQFHVRIHKARAIK